MYLNGDYNVIVNNCSSTPQEYYDYSYCDNTVTNGTCSNGAPLTVRCQAGTCNHIHNVSLIPCCLCRMSYFWSSSFNRYKYSILQ